MPSIDPVPRRHDVPLTHARRLAIAALLATGFRRLQATRAAADFSAGRSSGIPEQFTPSELALTAETSVTVHAG